MRVHGSVLVVTNRYMENIRQKHMLVVQRFSHCIHARRRPTLSAKTSCDQCVLLPIIPYIPICDYQNLTVNPHVATKAIRSPYIEVNLIAFEQSSTVDCIAIWFVVGSPSYYLIIFFVIHVKF